MTATAVILNRITATVVFAKFYKRFNSCFTHCKLIQYINMKVFNNKLKDYSDAKNILYACIYLKFLYIYNFSREIFQFLI